MSYSAGAVGIEPTLAVLETAVLPLNDAPLFTTYFTLFMHCMLPAPRAILFELNLPLHFLLVLGGVIIPALAHRTTQSY